MQKTLTKESPDLIHNLRRCLNFLKILLLDPVAELWRGLRTHALPVFSLSVVGILTSLGFLFHLDSQLFGHFHRSSIADGHLRDVLGIFAPFVGFVIWSYVQVGIRARLKTKLGRAFFNASIETRLKEAPAFWWDYPLDRHTRKLRLMARGIPLSVYRTKKEYLEAELNVSIANIENPGGNQEFVDIIYTKERLADLWELEDAFGFKNFSFPIGKSFSGEIRASLTDCPHFLVAGASGGGKSSFIRMMITVLLRNNEEELDVYFIDFKGGMENQVFEKFPHITLIDNPKDAAQKMNELNLELDSRMKDFKKASARNLEQYNEKAKSNHKKAKRLLVVVDEISELMPSVSRASNLEVKQVSTVINRIARLGRAVGVNLAIGVQKPDTKNLDPTIKANLTGVICFPVTHFSQSVVALGNSRAAELSGDQPGRAIWQRGSTQIEVQTPHLTEEGVNIAREEIAKTSKETVISTSGKAPPEIKSTANSRPPTRGEDFT